MPARLVDTHCHLDLYPDPAALAARCEAAGVYTIAVTNTPSVFEHTEALSRGARYVRPALGLHPELAIHRRGELQRMWELFDRTRYIGEIGLDYQPGNEKERPVQRSVFDQILQRCDAAGDKILTVHSRGAAEDVVAAVGSGFRGSIILHWYSGSSKILGHAVSQGCYLSINPAMCQARRFRSLLAGIPRDRILTETDGPFVAVGSRSADPTDVGVVTNAIAAEWGEDEQAVRTTVLANLRAILGQRSGERGPAVEGPRPLHQ